MKILVIAFSKPLYIGRDVLVEASYHMKILVIAFQKPLNIGWDILVEATYPIFVDLNRRRCYKDCNDKKHKAKARSVIP